MGEHLIHVLFLEPRGDDPWLNRLTARIGEFLHGQGFCHVEISLPNIFHGPYDHVTSSIMNNEHVTCTSTKSFSNPGYEQVTIPVSTEDLKSMLKYVHSCHDRQIGFDQLGMFCALLPVSLRGRPEGCTFCSRYVTETLQFAGVPCVRGLDGSITTPSKLYKMLTTHNNQPTVLGSVRYKKEALLKSGTFSYERV